MWGGGEAWGVPLLVPALKPGVGIIACSRNLQNKCRHLRTCEHTRTHVLGYRLVLPCTYANTFLLSPVFTYMTDKYQHTCVHRYAHTCIHAHIQAYIRTHMAIYMHVYSSFTYTHIEMHV